MWQPETLPSAYTTAAMMNPNANEMPSRSAPVIAGCASPARASVATTDPGPTRTSRAVPSVSAAARWPSEYESISPPPNLGLRFDNVESGLEERTPLGAARQACRLHLGEVLHRPRADRDQRRLQRLPERRQPVLDGGRDHVEDGPLHEPVGLHAAQRLREHLLRDAVDRAAQLTVALRAVDERVDHQAGPLVGDTVERLARLAVLIEHVRNRVHAAQDRHQKVPTCRSVPGCVASRQCSCTDIDPKKPERPSTPTWSKAPTPSSPSTRP